VAMITRTGLFLASVGIILGTIGAAMVSGVLETLLFDVTPLDVPVFLGVATLFLVVASAASVLPARRAARIEPLAALRQE
jgi:putative ABC transport system permease protein